MKHGQFDESVRPLKERHDRIAHNSSKPTGNTENKPRVKTERTVDEGVSTRSSGGTTPEGGHQSLRCARELHHTPRRNAGYIVG